jgi:hypothetical protein
MRKWLEMPNADKKKNDCHYAKRSAYAKRIQQRIDKELDSLLWLVMHYPQVFLDEENGHGRFKKLLLVVKNLNPKCDVELVLRRLDFPDKEELPSHFEGKRCRKCGKIRSSHGVGNNNLCHVCNQKQIFESIKAKEGKAGGL